MRNPTRAAFHPGLSICSSGTLAVISVYCPDKVGEFRQYADDLETADVAG